MDRSAPSQRSLKQTPNTGSEAARSKLSTPADLIGVQPIKLWRLDGDGPLVQQEVQDVMSLSRSRFRHHDVRVILASEAYLRGVKAATVAANINIRPQVCGAVGSDVGRTCDIPRP
jgi:hypothetical protein